MLKKLIYYDENITDNITRPLYDTFYFNGFDSQISLNVQNNTFEKSTLFFSFYLSPIQGRKEYPLFIIQKDFDGKKTDLLNIYLEKNETNKIEEFDLCIAIEKKEKKLDKIPKIKPNTTYYFSICFNIK